MHREGYEVLWLCVHRHAGERLALRQGWPANCESTVEPLVFHIVNEHRVKLGESASKPLIRSKPYLLEATPGSDVGCSSQEQDRSHVRLRSLHSNSPLSRLLLVSL